VLAALSTTDDARNSSHRLTHLELGANGQLGREGAAMLRKFFRHNPAAAASLQYLGMDTNELGDEGVAILAEVAAQHCLGLKTLNLACNQVTDTGVRALLDHPIGSLQTVMLEDNADLTANALALVRLWRMYQKVKVDMTVELRNAPALVRLWRMYQNVLVDKTLELRIRYFFMPEFKILLHGDGGVGRQTWVQKLQVHEAVIAKEPKYVTTLSVTVYPFIFLTQHGPICFNVWVASKEARFGPKYDGYFTQGQGAILMFDCTSRISYKNIPNHYRDVIRVCGDIPMVLAGNKVDMKHRQVKAKQITFHRKKNLMYYDVAVEKNFHVIEPFLWLAKAFAGDKSLQFDEAPTDEFWLAYKASEGYHRPLSFDEARARARARAEADGDDNDL